MIIENKKVKSREINILSFQVRYVKTTGKHRIATRTKGNAAKDGLERTVRKLAKLVNGGLILNF